MPSTRFYATAGRIWLGLGVISVVLTVIALIVNSRRKENF